jgi:Transglycosylase-like domain
VARARGLLTSVILAGVLLLNMQPALAQNPDRPKLRCHFKIGLSEQEQACLLRYLSRVDSWKDIVRQARKELAEARAVAAAANEVLSHGSVNWDAIAQCESGGNWQAGDGLGPDVTGGLQIATSTWLSNGGGQYASKAMYATREQQIAVAERVLATQGIGAWPYCGAYG